MKDARDMLGVVYPCECSDSACPAHPGVSACMVDCGGFTRLYRVDMQDHEGTLFCNKGCSEDALASGLFVTREA